MNLYLDTSALVKLFVAEPGSAEVKRRCRQASVVVTSRVAYPEARAAFARRCRDGSLSPHESRRAASDLDRDFARFVVAELTGSVVHLAGELAERHALRGFDAIHLASAVEFGQMVGTPPRFLCFDDRLASAAAAERLDGWS